MPRALLLVTVFSLLGCTATTPHGHPPKMTFHSKQPLDSMTACVVNGMDAAFKLGHYAQTKIPGQVVEVTSQRVLMVGGEPYFTRITAEPGGSLVEFFSLGPAFGPEAIAGCRD